MQTSSGTAVGCEAGGQYSVLMELSGQGPFRLQLDTGSSTVGVVSTLCDATCNGGHFGVAFNPKVNSTNTGAATSLSYGDQSSFTGDIFTSAVSLMMDGDGVSTELSVSTNVVAMTSQSGGFLTGYSCPFDSLDPTDYFQGIVGFAFPALNTPNGDTEWVSSYFAQYPNVSQEFTIQLCPIEDGTLWVGFYDPSHTSTNGVFQCAPILSQTYWSTQACGMSMTDIQTGLAVTTAIGDALTFGLCQSNGYRCAVFDSGTSYTYIPQSIYDTFVGVIRANAYYQLAFGVSGDPFDPNGNICGTSSIPPEQLRYYLPTLNLLLGTGADAAQCGATLSISMFGVDGYLSRFSIGANPAYYCATVFPTTSEWTFGDSFLQSYTVRHIVNSTTAVPPQICFAGSQGCADALPAYMPPASSSSSTASPQSSSTTPSSSPAPSSSISSPSVVTSPAFPVFSATSTHTKPLSSLANSSALSSSASSFPSSNSSTSSSVTAFTPSSSSPVGTSSSSTAPSSPMTSSPSTVPSPSLSSLPVPSSTFSSSATALSSASPPSTTALGSAVSDPRFYGFWGQQFYVTGVTGGVYNLLSDSTVVVNAYIVYLTDIDCPVIDGTVMAHCFNHSGTYFGVLAAHSANGDQLRITAGPRAEGFHAVAINDRTLAVGESYGERRVEGGSDESISQSGIFVQRVNARSLVVQVGVYEVVVSNSDGYVDLVTVNVSCWSCLLEHVRPEGLLGRTWNRSVDVSDSEELMPQYREEEDNIMGCHFPRCPAASAPLLMKRALPPPEQRGRERSGVESPV